MGGSGGQVLKTASTSRATALMYAREEERESVWDTGFGKMKKLWRRKESKGLGFLSNIQLGLCLLVFFFTHTAPDRFTETGEPQKVHSSSTGLKKTLMERKTVFIKDNGCHWALDPSCDWESLGWQLHIAWDFFLLQTMYVGSNTYFTPRKAGV